MARILVLEEDDLISTLLRDALEWKNHEVHEIHRGGDHSGWFLDGTAPDLVIVEWPPSVKGAQLLHDLSEGGGDTSWIGLFGGREEMRSGHEQVALDKGAACILSKPFNLEALMEAVDKALLDVRSADICDERSSSCPFQKE
jgi:DNA-binding response OmpR family regulator